MRPNAPAAPVASVEIPPPGDVGIVDRRTACAALLAAAAAGACAPLQRSSAPDPRPVGPIEHSSKAAVPSPAAAPAASAASKARATTPPMMQPPIVLSTWDHGLTANKAGLALLGDTRARRTALDAVEAGCRAVELDCPDMTVGLGSRPDREGRVTLDAAIMSGDGRAGCVAFVQGVAHPISLARLVMERTDHCLLVGEGAYKFARAHGHPHVELLTESTRKKWLEWRERHSNDDDWLPPAKDERNVRLERTLRYVAELERQGYDHAWGTIHCSALSVRGEVACTTTTSGLAWKIPGRVGDSPIIGAGLYCDSEAGSAGATGRGESSILSLASATMVEYLRRGAAPLDAGLETARRVVRQVERQARWQPALMGADDSADCGN